jgi:hypothetical protein
MREPSQGNENLDPDETLQWMAGWRLDYNRTFLARRHRAFALAVIVARRLR